MENSQPNQTQAPTQQITIVPWYISAGDDGLKMDCVMVAVMNGSEVHSLSLHLAGKATT